VIRTVLSACSFYQQVIIDNLCQSAVVSHYLPSKFLMRNHCSLIFKSKSQKLTLKYLKICSSNPIFFRSITFNPIYLSRPQSRDTIPLKNQRYIVIFMSPPHTHTHSRSHANEYVSKLPW
jgi:hypothetical protein